MEEEVERTSDPEGEKGKLKEYERLEKKGKVKEAGVHQEKV